MRKPINCDPIASMLHIGIGDARSARQRSHSGFLCSRHSGVTALFTLTVSKGLEPPACTGCYGLGTAAPGRTAVLTAGPENYVLKQARNVTVLWRSGLEGEGDASAPRLLQLDLAPVF